MVLPGNAGSGLVVLTVNDWHCLVMSQDWIHETKEDYRHVCLVCIKSSPETANPPAGTNIPRHVFAMTISMLGVVSLVIWCLRRSYMVSGSSANRNKAFFWSQLFSHSHDMSSDHVQRLKCSYLFWKATLTAAGKKNQNMFVTDRGAEEWEGKSDKWRWRRTISEGLFSEATGVVLVKQCGQGSTLTSQMHTRAKLLVDYFAARVNQSK